MLLCSVSIKGLDGWIHSLETEAGSLAEAAYAGVREWSRLWWYNPDAVIEVRAGDECWRISARGADEWHREQSQKARLK
ncbi:MAG TPA: hypothetical protein VKB79_16620 [Bryobacteraceae bacterium]|nr:hypothetical protein [Bryobacteraceae bacterium]